MAYSLELLRTVEPRQVAAWLRANGWDLVDAHPNRVATWRKQAEPEGEYLVELPLDANLRDYARRMAETLETLRIASGKPTPWLLAELRGSTIDIIRLRSTGPSVGLGRVPVEFGTRLFGHARELMLAAACSAAGPRSVYHSRKPIEATEFLRRVKLAVPEEGSFIVTIHVPVPPEIQPVLIQESPESPFERRATLMLASGISAARQAAERVALGGEATPFIDGKDAGISANLCDALAGFVDGEAATGLDVSFAWASSRLVPERTPTSVHIGSDLSPLLQAGARVLRASTAMPDFELEGAVVRLDSDSPDSGGVAVIAGNIDGQPRKVRVKMEAEDYALAIRAHEQGLLLRCEGELLRQRQRFQLDRVRYVNLVADED